METKALLAPIILFVYNRPEHTKRTVEGLLKNKDAENSILYIFADGAKASSSEDAKSKIEEVRNYIHTISGFSQIIIEESESNKGLAGSIIYGCTKVLNKHGKMIVLEDDCIPNEYFISYMNRCLNKYENDSRIWCISGYTDTELLPPRGEDDLFLVNRPSSWGYGTWKRCWDKVIWDVDVLKELFSHQDIVKGFNRWGGKDSSVIMFALFGGLNSSWAIRYNFAAYQNKAMTILPTKSLIWNIGCDGTGTHCGKIDYHLQMMDHEVIIPLKLKFDNIRNKQLYDSFNPKSLKLKVIYYLQNNFLPIYNRLKNHK